MLLNDIYVKLENNSLFIQNKSSEKLDNGFIEVHTIFSGMLLQSRISLDPDHYINFTLGGYNFKEHWGDKKMYVKVYQNHELIYEKHFNDKTKCFVLLSNKNFEKITEQLIIGLNRYSTVDVLHYTINYESDLNYPNLTNIPFNIPGDTLDGQYMQFVKAPVFIDVLKRGYENAAFLDSDIQVRSNIDDVFKYISEFDDSTGPILHKAFWDYTVVKGEYVPGPLVQEYLQLPIQQNPHGVTMIVLFNKQHLELFEEWNRVCFSKEIEEIRKKEFLHDELLLNCLLWKSKFKPKLYYLMLNVVNENDVNFFYNFKNPDHLLDINMNDFGLGHLTQSYIPYNKNTILGFHCVKDENIAKNINNIVLEKEKNIKTVMAKSIYSNLVKNISSIKTLFNVNFIDGPFLEIKSSTNDEYYCEFINPKTNAVEYSTTLKDGWWGKGAKKYFVNWNMKVYKNEELIYDYKYDCTGKRVYISLESKSLGDTLAWFPYAEEFRKKHNCQVIVSTFHNDFFKDQYPDLIFVNPGETVNNLYAMYNVGWFYEDNKPNLNRNLSDFKQIPLQQAASDILGLDPIEVKPKLKLNPNIKKEKQVSIAIHATAQSKYWNNPTGWQDVVNYLKELGYKVKLLSSEGDNYMGNKHPEGIEQLPAGPIEKVIEELQKSELFIGIGSGLSWLSWAVDVPTVLISGFSLPYSEIQDNVIRISPPKGICSGCYNRFKLDAGNWNWCPDTHKHEEFECTKTIKSSQVIEALNKIIK